MKHIILLLVLFALLNIVIAHGNHGHGCKRHWNPDTTEFHEYCSNTVVNGISIECREYWMRQSMEVQFNGSFIIAINNYMCPTSFFGAVLVEHGDVDPNNYHDSQGNNCGKKITQSSGQRGSLSDPSNHAETQLTRNVAVLFPNNGRNRALWGRFSVYTTGESCPGCAGYQVFAGYKEVIYGVGIDAFLELGDGQIDMPSKNLYKNQQQFVPSNPLVSIKGVLDEEMGIYFEWRLKSLQRPQPDFTCPSPCTKQLGSDGFYTCRMASLTDFDCPAPWRKVTVDGSLRCLL